MTQKRLEAENHTLVDGLADVRDRLQQLADVVREAFKDVGQEDEE